MDYEANRYINEVPYPDRADTKAAIQALDEIPLTVAERAAKAQAIKEEAASAHKAALAVYYAAQEKVMEKFRADAEENYGFGKLPTEVRKQLHSFAWQDGHSDGLYAVWYKYDSYAEIAMAAYEAGKNAKRQP